MEHTGTPNGCELCGEKIRKENARQQRVNLFEDIPAKAIARQHRAAIARKAKSEMLKSLGLVKVRGALGGTYWE